MVITLGNIVFGGKGNGGGAPAAYVVPDGMNFGYSTSIPFDDLDFSQRTNFSNCWNSCRALTSFPMLDLSAGTNFSDAWSGCIGLTEFPALNLSSGTNFYFAWFNCDALTTMGQLDLSSGINFMNAWVYCSSLTNLGGFGAIKASIDLSASTKLTVESIMNVITQAADLNSLGITGKTMKFGSDNLAKLTDEQKAIATNKGWTLA